MGVFGWWFEGKGKGFLKQMVEVEVQVEVEVEVEGRFCNN